MVKKLIKDILKQKGIYWLICISIIAQISMLTIPYLTNIYITYIQAGDLNTTFYSYIVLGLFIYTGGVLFAFYSDYLKSGISTRFEIEKYRIYYEKYLQLEYSHLQNEGTGKTITKITRGIDAQIRLFHSFFDLIVIMPVRIIFIGYIFLVFSWQLALCLLCLGITLILTNTRLSRRIKELTEQDQEISENISRQTNKIVMHSGLIKISGKEYSEIEKLKYIQKQLPQLRQKLEAINGFFNNILDIVFRALEIGLFAIFGVLVVQGSMTLGEIIMITTYIWWIWWPLNIIMRNITEYRNQLSKYEALEDFINTENTIIDGVNNFIKKDGTIEFRDVDFSYNDDRDIFKNFNLKITGGQKIAVIGKTGSGKSTFIQLLLRNYDTTKGSIYIDGQNIRDIKIASFYTNIGYLPQDPAVSDGTIRENLDYARQAPISDDEIWETLRKVELDELIQQSEKKLETEIGERGIKLSGGERQRLAIARIILKNPEILILDEATSALDTKTERLVQEAFDHLMDGRTSIIIAHRLSTIVSADVIYLMDKGRIVASGNHSELYKSSTEYKEMVDMQHDGFVGEETKEEV